MTKNLPLMTRVYGSGTNPIPPGQRRRNSSETERDRDVRHCGVGRIKMKAQHQDRQTDSHQEFLYGSVVFEL